VRKRTTLLCAVATASIGLLATSAYAVPASAKPATPKLCASPTTAMTHSQVKARSRQIHQKLFQMAEAGMTYSQMVAPLAKLCVRMGAAAAADADASVIVIPLSTLDGGRVNGTSGGKVASNSTTGSSIVVSTPIIAYDTQAHIYYATAQWHFSNSAIGQLCGEVDGGVCNLCNGCNVGGYDSFGLVYNHAVSITGEDATRWGWTSHYGPASMPIGYADSYGEVFKDQDRFNNDYGDYSMYNGEAVEDLSSSSIVCTGLGTYVRSSYGHDWSSTTISSFSIGPAGIGIGWSSSSHRWQVYSHEGIYC